MIISSFKSNASMAICRARVLLFTRNKYLTPRYFWSFLSSSLRRGPLLVSHPEAHIFLRYFWYFFSGGKYVFVTLIISYPVAKPHFSLLKYLLISFCPKKENKKNTSFFFEFVNTKYPSSICRTSSSLK